MQYTVIFIIVVAAILVSVFRAKKIKAEREEEKKREEERKRNFNATDYAKRAPAPQTKKATDPFGDYRGPYKGQEKPLTLTPAQLDEWLCGFEENERAGVVQITGEKGQSQFSRYLFESGFSYRQTRKLRGYAPQNRLFAVPVAYKTDGATITADTAESNTVKKVPDAFVRKVGVQAIEIEEQKSAFPALPPKDGQRRVRYENFYSRRAVR